MLYIDIETVPAFKSFDDADERTRDLFRKKMRMELIEWDSRDRSAPIEFRIPEDVKLRHLYGEKAGLFAEFNKIVCVSIGTVLPQKAEIDGTVSPEKIHIKSLVDDEEVILIALKEILDKSYLNLCAHFGKGFDFPVLCRKYVMYQIEMPRVLNISGLKPWEVPLHDTQEMWKFGDMRHSCSLDLLAHNFGLPSPKDQMDGSEVANYFYNVPDGILKISEYCEKDVRTLINVHRIMNYKSPIL